MNKTIKKIGTLVVSLTSITAATAPAATVLTFGGPGYVSQGNTYTYPAAGSSASSRNTGTDLNFFFFSGPNQVYIDFSAPKWTLLTTGAIYTNITQYIGGPATGKPSFNLLNNGKALSPIPDGWFKVLEIVMDPIYGVPTKFAADFVTYDSLGQPTGGSMRWSSTIAVTPINQIIPEVSTSFLLMTALGFISCQRRRT